MLTLEQQPNRAQSSYWANPGRPDRAESQHTSMVNPLLARQQFLGNQAVQRLLHSRGIQAKLTVNEPGDRYEQEADRVADEVMRMPDPGITKVAAVPGQVRGARIQRMCSECEEELQRQPMEEEGAFVGQIQAPRIQRLCAKCEEDLQRVELEKEEEEKFLQAKAVPGHTPQVSPEVEAQIEGFGGGGQRLPNSIRNFFEARFGRDFSTVRLHIGAQATESARAVNARAYTVGKNIVFGAGEFAPGTSTGRSLLAHELVHTIQQADSGGAPATQLLRTIGDGHDLRAPRFSGNVELEAAFDGELLISVQIHSRGTHVRLIQESLLAQGYTLPGFRADGAFSAETKAAVTRFQTDAGAIRKDGIVGSETMQLLDERDPSLRTGLGPVAITGPVSGPRPAPATGCDRAFTGVTFALADQAGKGVSPAAAIRILQDTQNRHYLEMVGRSPVWYRPEVTIAAPDDPTAKQFQVGFIQNLLSSYRVAFYDDGSRVGTDVPTVPIKDGAPLSSGKYDPVFTASDDVEGFTDKEEPKDLKFSDVPRDSAYISLLDNPSCFGRRLPGTMVNMTMYDEFRTWLAVRHQPTGCVRPLHHIDWNLLWDANVTMLGDYPVLKVNNNVCQATVANGDGRPGFIQGGRTAKDVAHKKCV